jgi:hypothetical protein
VKIKGTCKRDGRDFLVDQAVQGAGACPWDGEPFSADYAVVLVDALRDAEAAGSRFETALEKIADISPAFTLSEASIVGPLRAQIERLQRNLVRRG